MELHVNLDRILRGIGIVAFAAIAIVGCGETTGSGGAGGSGASGGSAGMGGSAGVGGEGGSAGMGGVGGSPLADCGPLEAPSDGSVSTPDGTAEGSTATYSCMERFNLTGEGTRTCQSDGTWSGEALTCTACEEKTATINAVENVSVQYTGVGHLFRDNNTRAYNNPAGTCSTEAPCDVTGWLGFDLSSIPNSVIIDGMRLFAYTTSVQQAQPTVRVQYSSANDWAQDSVAFEDLPRTSPEVSSSIVNMVPGDVGAYKGFPINLEARDFRADLIDDWTTLGVDNTEPTYSYAYFEGVSGANVPYLEIDYCE